jgi:ferrochelatase
MTYDALLIVSFGGPERREDVIPFREMCCVERTCPADASGGRALLSLWRQEPHQRPEPSFDRCSRARIQRPRPIPPYLTGRPNWHAMLADTLRQMDAGGVRRALAFATSAF